MKFVKREKKFDIAKLSSSVVLSSTFKGRQQLLYWKFEIRNVELYYSLLQTNCMSSEAGFLFDLCSQNATDF
jgi:hypothetical protein